MHTQSSTLEQNLMNRKGGFAGEISNRKVLNFEMAISVLSIALFFHIYGIVFDNP